MKIVLSAVAAVSCLLAGAGPAAAKAIPVDLRVEGANSRALTADRYLTSGTSVTTAQQAGCEGTGATKQLAGPTALGVLVDGELVNRRLDPLLVSDQFSFGLLVCGVGGDSATGSSSYWVYKVNHASPEVGGDAFRVKSGDDVLWYFVDGARNSGDELELVAPARVQPGEEFGVQVYAYDFAGVRRPIQGVTVAGGGATATSDAAGAARLTLDDSGNRTLRATLDPHIPSAPTKVCVNDDLSRCSPARGGRIWGSRRAERISGSAGRDVVLAGAGNDRISVRRGDLDTVRCGRGRDTVLGGTRDKIARDCEFIHYRGRR
jgi:hypothetical protein